MEFSEYISNAIIFSCYLALIAGMILGVVIAINTDGSRQTDN